MTGPEHYRLAELIIEGTRDKTINADVAAAIAAAAQVHATLALAAATGLNDGESGMPVSDWREWREAAGTKVRT
jgi:hypothetical protein